MKTYTTYGNCQVTALASALNSSSAFRKEYKYVPTKPVQTLTGEDLDRLLEQTIPKIDLLIYQPVSEKFKNNFKFSSDYLLSLIKPSCRYLSFPSCYFSGYRPELKMLRNANNTLMSIPITLKNSTFANLVHDVNILKAFLDNKTVEDIKNQIFSLSFYSPEFIQESYEQTLNELKRRETDFKLDIIITDFIHKNFKIKKLFHTMNHPTHLLIEYIASRICESLNIEADIKPNSRLLSTVGFPIYSSIYNFFNLEFENQFHYSIAGEDLEAENFIEQCLKFYETIPKAILKKNIQDWKIN